MILNAILTGLGLSIVTGVLMAEDPALVAGCVLAALIGAALSILTDATKGEDE
jgi:hypothetical protein